MANNAAIARRFFDEVWNQRREEVIDEVLAADSVGMMEGRDRGTRDDYKDMRRAMLDAFPDAAVTVEDTVEQGEKVVVRWSALATHTGQGLGIPPTNRQVAFRGMSWLEFKGGQIVRAWDSWNLGGLMQAIIER